MSKAEPIIGVLALQGGVAEHLRALERSGAVARAVRRPEELDQVHGLVLPGGESTTMTRLLENFELDEPLRQRLSEGMPAYGSCAGMVLLAGEVHDERPGVRPLGAIDMVVRRNAFGRQADSFESDLDFAGITDGPVHAVFIRAPLVEKVGAGVDVLASVPDATSDADVPDVTSDADVPDVTSDADVPDVTSDAESGGTIVAVQQGPVLATAFHPELVSGDERVHRYFVRTVRAR